MLATDLNENELVSNAQQGDKWAFGELVRRHHQSTVTVAYRMCGDVSLAEDAAQNAFIKAWQSIPSYKPRSPFRNWLYRIAVNAALDLLRREPGRTEDIDELQLTSSSTAPEAAVIELELGARVQQAVLSLPPASRAVLVLREYESLAYREIADILDIPVGTVMSRLNYARKLLRESLEMKEMFTEEANG